MTLAEHIAGLARAAKDASLGLAQASTEVKNQALQSMAVRLERETPALLRANERDLTAGAERGLSPALLDRLRLTGPRLDAMAQGLREVVNLPDPVGEMTGFVCRPSGIRVGRMRIPLGLIGIIYESRPNVTVDAAGLCLKSGNAVILRGGSEAQHSNRALAEVLQASLREVGLPGEAVTVVDTTDREAVRHLLQLEGVIDVVIPRGGEALIRFVAEHSRIPTIKHYKGTCHVYVDQTADLEMATAITLNAKVQRPGVCNAAETLLVHQAVASEWLPLVGSALEQAGVEIRGCPRTVALLPYARPATEEDWPAEYLDLILAVKVVQSFEEAVQHIRTYGSLHTEAIITNDHRAAMRFIREVDSSSVMVNASTRFADGGEYGLGAEIGISTSKLHAYGPMGLRELTCEKFVVLGDGQTRG